MLRPDLQHRPVIVLSNNDGCAIARSNEAKELGVRMGHPWHEIRHLEHQAGLVALSANFALYGDMSDRMASLVAALGHRHEVYSMELIPKTAIDASTASILPVGKSLTSTM